jgi:hypothetical protein
MMQGMRIQRLHRRGRPHARRDQGARRIEKIAFDIRGAVPEDVRPLDDHDERGRVRHRERVQGERIQDCVVRTGGRRQAKARADMSGGAACPHDAKARERATAGRMRPRQESGVDQT